MAADGLAVGGGEKVPVEGDRHVIGKDDRWITGVGVLLAALTSAGCGTASGLCRLTTVSTAAALAQ